MCTNCVGFFLYQVTTSLLSKVSSEERERDTERFFSATAEKEPIISSEEKQERKEKVRRRKQKVNRKRKRKRKRKYV